MVPGSVSIPSPSGLLQNFLVFENRSVTEVSIPSPSGLLQNVWTLADAVPAERFQSLLLQVSFKTTEGTRRNPPCGRFNPFSFRSPSKRRLMEKRYMMNRFNPFSFRSPSKRYGAFGDAGRVVSIPSPSGLLQNPRGPGDRRSFPFQSLLLQVSFKTFHRTNYGPWTVSIPSPSGLLQNHVRHKARNGRLCFNPFSFRSPSKPYSSQLQLGSSCFNPFSFRSPSKPRSNL